MAALIARAGFVQDFEVTISPSQQYAHELPFEVEQEPSVEAWLSHASSVSSEVAIEGGLDTFPGFIAAPGDPASPLIFLIAPDGDDIAINPSKTLDSWIVAMEFDNGGGLAGGGDANIANVMFRISMGF